MASFCQSHVFSYAYIWRCIKSQVMYFMYCSLDLNFFCSHQLKQKRKRKSTVIGCVIVIRYPFLRSSTSDYIFFSNFAIFDFLVVFLQKKIQIY
ncbi:hypothetical protein CsatA_027954 [Cannabis sativa]